MAIIVPKYESTRQPAGRIGSPLSVPQLEGPRMVGEAARRFEEITAKLKRAKQTTELSNAQTDLFKTLVELENDFQNRTDYGNFEPEFKKRVDDLREHYQSTIQDPEVLEAFRPDFERMTTRSLVSVRSMARHQEIDQGRADFNRNQETYLETIRLDPDPEKRFEALNLAKVSVAGSVNGGYISREEGQKRIEALNYTALKTNAWQSAQRLGYEEGIQWLENEQNAHGLHKDDRDAMIVDLRREWNLAKQRDREALEAEIWETENEFLNKFRNRALSYREIEASPLSIQRKEHWIDLIDKQAKDDRFDRSDPKVYAEWSKRVHTEPESIKDAGEIYAVLGKGLGTDDVEKLVNAWRSYQEKDKADKPLQSSAFKNAVKILDVMMQNGLFVPDKDPEDYEAEDILKNRNEWARIYAEIERAVQEGKDPQEELNTLLQPYFERNSKGWLHAIGQAVWKFFVPGAAEKDDLKKLSRASRSNKETDEKRQRAIDILQQNNKQVNEETIKKVMDQL